MSNEKRGERTFDSSRTFQIFSTLLLLAHLDNNKSCRQEALPRNEDEVILKAPRPPRTAFDDWRGKFECEHQPKGNIS